jgi:hypothetical protein
MTRSKFEGIEFGILEGGREGREIKNEWNPDAHVFLRNFRTPLHFF